jgi:hypothetical protein
MPNAEVIEGISGLGIRKNIGKLIGHIPIPDYS